MLILSVDDAGNESDHRHGHRQAFLGNRLQDRDSSRPDCLKDADVLALTARDGRVLVTHDQTTMPKHFTDFIRSTASPGLIIVPQSLGVREAADTLILVWAATERDEWNPLP